MTREQWAALEADGEKPKALTGEDHGPWGGAEMTREEILVVLIEECGEVIQAATKCLRFGWDRDHPLYGVNHEVLAQELGDVLGVADALNLRQDLVTNARRFKMAKVLNAHAKFGVQKGGQMMPKPITQVERLLWWFDRRLGWMTSRFRSSAIILASRRSQVHYDPTFVRSEELE
jgi:NTP pyrophosphatase (non-canonical NTP hydrolase)